MPVSDDIVRYLARFGAPNLRVPLTQDRAEVVVDAATDVLKYQSGGTHSAVVLDLTQTLTGDKTLSGTTTLSGTVACTGATTGLRRGSSAVESAATRTLTTAESGAVMLCTATSGTQVFTLPAAATAGLQFSFVCGAGAAAGEVQVGVATGDNIIGKTHGAQDATGLVSTVSTGLLKNTAATNVVGDHTTLVSDGVTTWYMVTVAGVWSVT